MVQVLCDALAAVRGGPHVLGVRGGFCVCVGGGLCVEVVRVCVCFGAFLCVRVFVCFFVCLCLCDLVVCLRLCVPSLRLLCVFPFWVCSAVSVFVVFSCAVSCVLIDFRLPS